MRVGVLEAKNRLSELLERAAAGEEVVITKRGEAVARLTGVDRPASREEAERLVAQGRRLRESLTARSSWARNKADRDEGRRF